MIFLTAALWAHTVLAVDQLTLGYPTQLTLTPNVPCVVDVFPSIGAPLMRVYVDVNDLGNTLLLGHLQVNVGRYRDGPPSATAGSGAQSLQKNGDIMTTIDRPTFAGVPEKWWIVVTSTALSPQPVLVTAVCYDIAERPRVDIEFGKRSGVIAVEEGALEVFTAFVDAMPATKVTVNVDTAKFLAFADSYKVYVNIITLSKVVDVLKSLSWNDLAGAIGAINAAFRGGSVDKLPGFLTPDATKADLTLDPSFWTGKVDFALPANEAALVLVSIVGKKSVIPFSGSLTAYTVKFSLGDDDGMDRYTVGTCGSVQRRRDVAAAGSPCDNKPCAECVADAACSYCLSAPAGESRCRAKAAACTATSGAGVAAASAEQCRACIKIVDATACAANTANYCTFCTAVSAGAATAGCTDRWQCAELSAPATNATAAPALPQAGGATTTTAAFFTNAAGATTRAAALVALAAACAALW